MLSFDMDEIIQMFHGWFVWLSRLHPNPEKIFIWRMFSKLVKLFKLFSAKDWNTENLKSLSLAILNLDHWRSWPFSTSWIRICIFIMPGAQGRIAYEIHSDCFVKLYVYISDYWDKYFDRDQTISTTPIDIQIAPMLSLRQNLYPVRQYLYPARHDLNN